MEGLIKLDEENSKMVLVDTSVWIDFLRGTPSPEKQALTNLIETGENIATCGIILQEVLQGIISDLHYHETKKYFSRFDYLKLVEPLLFEKAADIYRICRKKGKTIRKPVDCLIAAISIHYNAILLHNDRDFSPIAQYCSLQDYFCQ